MTPGDTALCKHCGERITLTGIHRSWVHGEGRQAGKHTCALPTYGYMAEPTGQPCGLTCVGYRNT